MRAVSAQAPVGSTKHKIIETATRLFAEHGLDAVALRDIARSAGVNGAAVNYHFGSKELLIREVYQRLFSELNKLRTQALDDCEIGARGKRVDPERVIRAMFEPTVRFSMSPENGGVHFIPLLFHAYGIRRSFIEGSISEQVDHIAVRYVNMMQKALPNVSREDLFWRFEFSLGACHRILIDRQRGQRARRLSGGLCDTGDAERIIAQLVTSLRASFTAPSLSPSPKKPTAKALRGKQK